MTDAPERIWATASDDGWLAPYCGLFPCNGATEYIRKDLPATDAQVIANKKVRKLVEAVDGAATIANGALDSTAAEATFRRDLVRIRNGLRAALRDLEGGND